MLPNTPVRVFRLGAAVALVLFAVSACTDTPSEPSDDPSDDPGTSVDYAGPGSMWTFSRTGGTFVAEKAPTIGAAPTLTVNGTMTSLSTGFELLTVTSASGPDAPSAGSTAWALEVPGYALIVNPIGPGSDQAIVMVSAGLCPTAAFNANWVVVKQSDGAAADNPGANFFGTASFAAGTLAGTLPHRYALTAGFPDVGSYALGGGTCVDGIMDLRTSADAILYLTTNGGAIVHTAPSAPGDASHVFALAQKTISAMTDFNGAYAGLLFDDTAPSGDKVSPVSMDCTAGICTARRVTDINTGATEADAVSVALSGTPNALGPGLVTGTITQGTDGGSVACMVDANANGSGRAVVNCVGQSPGDNAHMFNALFVSR